MRGLHAINNRTIKKQLTEQRNLFKHVSGIDKTEKRDVSSIIIRQIREYDLIVFPVMGFAGDIFYVLVLYTRIVIHQYGMLEEKRRPAKRYPLIPLAEDGIDAFYQVGKTI